MDRKNAKKKKNCSTSKWLLFQEEEIILHSKNNETKIYKNFTYFRHILVHYIVRKAKHCATPKLFQISKNYFMYPSKK